MPPTRKAPDELDITDLKNYDLIPVVFSYPGIITSFPEIIQKFHRRYASYIDCHLFIETCLNPLPGIEESKEEATKTSNTETPASKSPPAPTRTLQAHPPKDGETIGIPKLFCFLTMI